MGLTQKKIQNKSSHKRAQKKDEGKIHGNKVYSIQ